MPELPEIETTRRVTGPLMTGRTILSVCVNAAKMVIMPSPEEFCKTLEGRRITEVGRRAKILLVWFDDGSHMVMRFGMTGALLCVNASEPVHRHARITFTFDDGTRAEFRDMRMFGHIWLIPPETEDTFSGIGDVGLEPDDPGLTGKFLKEHLGKSSRPVKSALLEQCTVCGLGNIYTDETLWRSRVCPESPCSSLRKKDWDAIAENIPCVISEAIEGNAVSAEDFLLDGGVHYRHNDFDAYGREGKPCSRCGTLMVRSVIGQRSSVWCPRCQKRRRLRLFYNNTRIRADMSLADTLNNKLWGDMSTGHFIGMVIGLAVALLVMCFLGSSILGWMLAAALCYLIAHLFHNTHKEKIILGVVACVFIVVIGGLEVGPSTLEAREDDPDIDTDYFHDVAISYNESTGALTVTTAFGDDLEGYTPVIGYSRISMIVYGGVYSETIVSDMDLKDISSGSYTFENWDTSNLNYIVLLLASVEDDGSYTAETGTVGFTDMAITDDDCKKICWIGSAYATAFFALIFFVITLGSWFFRSRMKKTRQKMEEQGRLYPQGYGRCANCGAIVLPGEVECRKCGTYIDRPDEMKPKKVDYFRCTNCGAEVPSMAEVCPKCGATFTEEETEVVHADGSVTFEKSFTCPDCGTSVPPGADGIRICPKCGKRFQD